MPLTALTTPTGQRTTHVTFQQLVKVSDGQGGTTASYVNRAPKSWALVEPLTSRETLLAKALQGVLQSALMIPFRTDLHITDRVLVGARTLQLTSFQDPSGRRVELRVLVAEVLT